MKLELASGRIVSLVDLRMRWTYCGVLCGAGHPPLFRMLTDKAQTKARELLPEGVDPVLIEHVGDALPVVTCIGEFHSGELPKPGSEPYSSVVVVWFQETYTPAISESALGQIRALDWDRLAYDWNW